MEVILLRDGPTQQRYVAKEWTHFVGRVVQLDAGLDQAAKREAQYDQLVGVLQTGELRVRRGLAGWKDA